MKKLVIISIISFITLTLGSFIACNKTDDPFQIKPEWPIKSSLNLSNHRGDWSLETEICLIPPQPKATDASRDSLLKQYEK